MSYGMVQVESPARGGGTQATGQFFIEQFDIQKSWGLQPARAMVSWVKGDGPATLIANAMATITCGGHVFHGLLRDVVDGVATSGRATTFEFVDSREMLQWDTVFGSFNKGKPEIVDGEVVRRYEHCLPADWPLNRKTVTDAPYSAGEILDFLFAAPTVKTLWTRQYLGVASAILAEPVYDVDFSGGRTLGTAIVEVSERLGLVFTLLGSRYNLAWCRKGDGTTPAFPANSNNRRIGMALSGNPTQVRVVGDRNVYMAMNIDLERDWLVAYEAWPKGIDDLANDILEYEVTDAAIGDIPKGTAYNAIPNDEGHLQGSHLARERALTITVAEYAALREADEEGSGALWLDTRMFGGRSRTTMPVAVYLTSVRFRCFRIPSGWRMVNRDGKSLGMDSLEVASKCIAHVAADPGTGKMEWNALDPAPTGTPGLMIAQGFQIEPGRLIGEIRPERFDPAMFRGLQSLWRSVGFSVDNSDQGDQFLIADEAIVHSLDWIVNPVIDGVTQGYGVINENATFIVPAVRVSLCLAAERFMRLGGVPGRDAVESVPGLNAELVVEPGKAAVELAYADGETATQKADAILAGLLSRQWGIVSGGYQVMGSNATALSPVIDRVKVTLSASGLTESVDFTTERGRNSFEPERDFDRRAQEAGRFPGQDEFRVQAARERGTAVWFRRDPSEQHKAAVNLDTLRRAESGQVAVDGGTGTLPVGTPLFQSSAASPQVVMPSASTTSTPVLAGVTVHEGARATRDLQVKSGGVVLARVMGPVAALATVGLSEGHDYLEASSNGVGQVLEPIAGAVVQLVQVRLGAAAGGGSLPVWV